MGSSLPRPIDLHHTTISKASTNSKSRTPLKNHYNTNESKLINAFIIDFEREYPMLFPFDIIPIIIYYYNKITESKWFEISKLLSLNDFSLKKMKKYSFGTTFQAELKSNSTMYTLQIFKKRDLKISTYSSRKLISTIDHPFIWCLRNAFETKTKLFLVRDRGSFCAKNLFSFLAENHKGKFTESMARFYTAEICLAIEHIHSLNVVYLDLCPSNILLTADGHILITDIDISMSDNRYLSHCYDKNPQYIAPEILKAKYCYYTKMADWWSVGMILYEMFYGLPPFYDKDLSKMYQNILCEEVIYYRHYLSDAAINILSKLLRKEASQRIGFEQIKKERFFECINWEKLYRKEMIPPFITRSGTVYGHTRRYKDEGNYSFPENYECYERRSSSSCALLAE